MKPKDAKSRRTAPLNTPTDLGANATKDAHRDSHLGHRNFKAPS